MPELTKTEKDDAEKASEWLEFCAHPWWAIEKGYILTEDEHEKDPLNRVKPFPDKEYLRAIAEIYLKSNIIIILKSRQVMLTWLFCYLLLHEAVTVPGSLCMLQGKREEDVLAKGTKAVMGRLRFMRKHLPAHLQPALAEEESKSTEVYDNGSTVMGIPQGEDIIRSHTASRVFMDELPHHPNGEDAWTAALPTVRGGGKLIGIGTPNGREFCYDQADERLKWDDWEKWPSVQRGIYGYQNTKGMQLVAIHYTADPSKRSVEYQQDIQLGYTSVARYRQENELDFSLQPGEGVYKQEFNEEIHVLKQPYKVDIRMPIYRGWDFGYNGQAVSFFQHNARGQLVWFDQIFLKRVALQKVCREAIRRSLIHARKEPSKDLVELVTVPLRDLEGNLIEGAHLARRAYQDPGSITFDYGDPSGEAHNTKGETDRDTLLSFGFQLHTKTTTGRKRDIVEQLRALLLLRSDGTPGLLISPGPFIGMQYVIEGFKGGYRYPESRQGRADRVLPHKDGFYDHIFDGAQYAIDNVRPIRPGMIDDEGLEDDSWKGSEWADNTLRGVYDEP